MENTSTMPSAVMGNFYDPDKLIHAAEHIRDAGYEKFDIYTPYPIHGINQAMGDKRTPLPKFSLGGALFGLSNAIGLMWWTGSEHYPLNIGGKPLFALQFAVPVMFELTVLLCALTTVFVMFGYLCRLPKWFHEYQHDAGFRAAVDDTFVVAIQSDDKRYTESGVRALLEKLGAEDVRLVDAKPDYSHV